MTTGILGIYRCQFTAKINSNLLPEAVVRFALVKLSRDLLVENKLFLYSAFYYIIFSSGKSKIVFLYGKCK